MFVSRMRRSTSPQVAKALGAVVIEHDQVVEMPLPVCSAWNVVGFEVTVSGEEPTAGAQVST
jgi:hypothetical protein